MNFGFNIIKVKDDVNSVNKDVPDAIVSLPNNIFRSVCVALNNR